MTKPETLTVSQVVEGIGLPTKKWEGNCYLIACKVVEAGLVKGTPVYGHYLGPVHKRSMFYEKMDGAGFSQHGWVLLEDGRIFDPTRWVFEVKRPYLFIGPAGKEYDEGGNQLRKVMRSPVPEYNPEHRSYTFPKEFVATQAWRHILRLVGPDPIKQKPGELTVYQISWVANCAYDDLGPYAMAIYDALVELTLSAFIPQDNMVRARREAGRL